ncbi:hypothetical protein ACJX0J_009184, partial [Zea mays]
IATWLKIYIFFIHATFSSDILYLATSIATSHSFGVYFILYIMPVSMAMANYPHPSFGQSSQTAVPYYNANDDALWRWRETEEGGGGGGGG